MRIQGKFKSFLKLVVFSAAVNRKWRMIEFFNEELK